MPDDADYFVCDAGHEIGAVWPNDGECPLCGCLVHIVRDDMISFEIYMLLENWAAFYDSRNPVTQASHLVEVSNAMYHLRPWLAKQAQLLGDEREAGEADPDFGDADPAAIIDFIANWQPPTYERDDDD